MNVYESNGIITGKDNWEELSSIIIDYIYDIEDGLNGDPFYNEDIDESILTLKNINSYYKYKKQQTINDIVPSWIGNLNIMLTTDPGINGTFVKYGAKLNNNKLDFDIKLNTSLEQAQAIYTLNHEFRHAYTRYLELRNNFSLKSDSQKRVYNKITKLLVGSNDFKLVKKSSVYDVEIDELIFNDTNQLFKAVLITLYIIDPDEMNSFRLQYSAELTYLLKEHQLQIKLLNQDNHGSIISSLFQLGISPYMSSQFRKYMAFYKFWNDIDKIDNATIVELFGRLSNVLNIFLYKKNLPTNILSNFNNPKDALLKIQHKCLLNINRQLLMMKRIFANKIINIT